MKAIPTIFAVLIAAGVAPAADEIDEEVSAIGLLPSQRMGQRITPQERNPFALAPKEAKLVQSEDTETQESRIRAIFRKIEVSGVRRDAQGRLMALAGDLILREGEEVKPVMVDQTETLVVSKVGPDQVELTFVETKDSTQPRTIPLPIKNRVLVSQKLFGQPKGQRSFYTVTGKKGSDAAIAAAMAAVQRGSGAASASSWQGAPESLTGPGDGSLVPLPQAADGAPAVAATSIDPAAGLAGVPVGAPAPRAGVVNDVEAGVTRSEPAPSAEAGPTVPLPGGKDLAAPAPTVPAPSIPAPAVPLPAVPAAAVPAAQAPVPAIPAPPLAPPVPAPAAASAPPVVSSTGMVSPPTFLRRHADQPVGEPEARTVRPAVAPPAPGEAPATVE